MNTMSKSRNRLIVRILPIILTFSMLFQACQPTKIQPNPTESNPEVSATTTPTQQATSTTAQTSPSQPATATATPTIIPEQNLAELLDQALIEGVDWHIGIETLDGERLYARNPDEIFFPASMIKIPLAMVVLKILEYRGDTVEDIHNYGIGRNFSTMLEAMVIRSEEQATMDLEYFARGSNRLRNYLDWWGLKKTTFNPRRSTVDDLLLALKKIYTHEELNDEFSNYLLDLMSTYTENDENLLGVMLDDLPQCTFYNKRGTNLKPIAVADMGILKCGEKIWYIAIAGSPSADSKATYEDIQASLEQFGKFFSKYVQEQISD